MQESIVAEWVKEQLKGFDVDEDTLGDYIASIVVDENEELESRLSVVESVLLGSSEEDFSAFFDSLKAYIQSGVSNFVAVEEVKEEHLESHSNCIREKINQERLEAKKVQERKAIDVKEMRQREQLLNIYGFDVVEVDNDGNLLLREQKNDDDNDLEGGNENALRVKMEEKMKREVMKTAHDQEVKRNKDAEAKRKIEKEKRKPVKQERRGRGT